MEDGQWALAVNRHPPSSILHPRRLLVRGTNWLGDAVMTTPALLRLREKFPDAQVTLLCAEKLRDLWRHHPAINETISFGAQEGLFAVAGKLRAGQFDTALVLPNSPRSALEVFLARIPQRIGYARPWRNIFLTQTVQPRIAALKMHKRSVSEIKQLAAGGSPRHDSVTRSLTADSAHQIHEYLHLAAALGASPEPCAPQLFVTPEETEAAEVRFNLQTLSRPVFGLNPGAEYGPAKRWPVQKFIAAAQQIQSRTGCVWLIFGGKNDDATAAQIQSAIGNQQSTMNLAGQTTLRELMALLKFCRVLLTNDTGPMHVAAALGTPVVVPFGSTSPELTGPGLPGDSRHWLLKSNAPCAPCFLRECPIDFRCMNSIDVEQVVEAVAQAHLDIGLGGTGRAATSPPPSA
jgi:heptosyltransferase-2